MKWQETSFMGIIEHAKDRIVYCGGSGGPIGTPVDYCDEVYFTDQTIIAVSSYYGGIETNRPRYLVYK